MEITKDLVLLYLLGELRDPHTCRSIESARERDPEVSRWFRLLDVAPEKANDETEDANDETEDANDETEDADDAEADPPPSASALAALRSMTAPPSPAPIQRQKIRRLAVSLEMALSDQADAPATERGRGWWIDSQQRLVFRYAASDANRYGAVLIRVLDGDQLVGAKLVAADKSSHGTYYGNSVALAELLGDREYRPSMLVEFFCEGEEIARRVRCEEVDTLLASPYVVQRPHVAACLQELRAALTITESGRASSAEDGKP